MKSTTFILAAATLLLTFENAARAADSPAPFYQVTVVQPNIKAINYEHLSGTTKIGLRGTVLLPKGEGKAAVKSEMGAVRIEASFKNLEAPSLFDPSDLTYVLWAISPEGRAVNLGELILDDGSSSLTATTQLQTFALVVTAEPYYSVTQPGNVVVLENVIPENSTMKFETVEVKYEFQKRGQYTSHGVPEDMKPVAMDDKVPFELYQARNAIKVARAEGADVYAPEAFNKADQSLQEAEGYQLRRRWYSTKKRQVIQASRRAVQGAEDARLIALKRKEDSAVARKISDAQDLAQQAQAGKAAADQAKDEAVSDAEESRLLAEKSDAAKDRALSEAEKSRLAAADSDQARQQSDAAKDQALSEAEKSRLAAASSDQARQQSDLLRQKAESDKADSRAALRKELNMIFATRDTARGLIMNMPNALFASGKHDLNPVAREKLAKIAGVVISHRGLRLTIEGYTDGVGGDEYNQRLSEMRAGAVKDYLAESGVSVDALTAQGFGKTKPLASNDTAEGRAKNRRVEIVVSGDQIGTPAVDASSSSVVPSKTNQ
jgi:outer membrane protein OmpA-like peptidoglycan-associated protein